MKNLLKSFKELKWYEWIMMITMIAIAGQKMVVAFMYPETSSVPAWLSVVNFFSGVCGIICIFFCAKASISNFLFGVINCSLYVVYLAYSRIFGTMCMEIFVYIPVNIISWIIWSKHRDNKDPEKTLTRKMTIKQNILSLTFVIVVTLICHFILVKLNGEVPWLDSLTVSLGLVATFLSIFRFTEQYIWWIIADIISVAMYVVHFDPVYFTKKSIYLIMAIIGIMNWRKLNKERNAENK